MKTTLVKRTKKTLAESVVVPGPMKLLETLWEETGGKGQGNNLSGCYRIEGARTLRVLVHQDTSYPEQSRAHIELWVGGTVGWTDVAHIIAQKVTSLTGARDMLIHRARQVFGI